MKTVLIILITFISLNIFGQSQWITQNPRSEIFDVEYLSENTLIRIGEDGIFKTTNDGDDWVTKWTQDIWNPSTKIQLNKIFFIDSLTGWVSGISLESISSGYLFKTVDGGENWEELTELGGERFFDMSFIDENTGWAAAGPRYSYHASGKILKTTNGGLNWFVVRENLEWVFKSVYFCNADTGWAAAEYSYAEKGKIVKTTDGGNTWVVQSTDVRLVNVFQITFTDANNGWLIGLYGDENDRWFNAAFKTSDGGENWNKQSDFEKIVPQIWLLNSVHFENPMTGWVSCKLSKGNHVIRGAILNTTNGGLDWNLQIESESFVYNSVDFYNSSKAIAVGTDGGVIKTENGGQDWIESFSIVTEYLHSVFFTDENNGVVVGDGKILKTSNGGSTWKVRESEADRYLRSVFFTDKDNGWSVGGGSYFSIFSGSRHILKTSNGGENWTVVLSDSSDGLSSVYFTDINTGYSVGAGGQILKTTNAGLDWVEQISGTPNNLFSVFFISDSTGWIVGDNATILNTTNSGEEWIEQISNIPGYRSVNSVFFIDKNNGWAVSDGGHVLKTTNGGLIWSYIELEYSGFLNSVHFVDNLNGWIVGQSGRIYYSDNAGENWTVQEKLSNDDLWSIYFYNPSVGYAVGRQGRIIKYLKNNLNYVPEKVALTYPKNDDDEIPLGFNFDWKYSNGAQHYKIQCALDTSFLNIIFERDSIIDLSKSISGLEHNTIYFWRVNASNIIGTGEWSKVWSFKTRSSAQNWFVYNTVIEQDITSICFIDKNTGWLTTGNDWTNYSNIYYVTSNGGINWLPKTTNLQRIDNISFFDEETGLASLSQAYGTGFQFALTNDGGKNWTQFGHDFVYNSDLVQLPSKTIGFSIVSGTGLADYDEQIKKVNLSNMSSQYVDNPGFGSNRANKIFADFIDENTGWVAGKEAYDQNYNFKRAFIYKTINGGDNWELQYELIANYDSVNSDYIIFNDVDAVDENNIWVCGKKAYGLILNSTDGGVNWVTKFQDNTFSTVRYPKKISFSDPLNGCAIIQNETSNGIGDYLLQTFDGGETWHPQYLNMFTKLNDIQMVDSTTGYAIGDNGLVLKFQDSTTVVRIAGEEDVLPEQYELLQNYPNPFNPETTIKFSLPNNSKVVLEIYNILGQRVRELINKDLSAGYHEVKFNSTGLASGVYIYRIQADENSGKNKNGFMEVKKMILLK